MTNGKYLKWVADHLSSFHPMITSATMEYINDEGYHKTVFVRSEAQVDNVELLKQCVEKAIIGNNESLQPKENVRAKNDS